MHRTNQPNKFSWPADRVFALLRAHKLPFGIEQASAAALAARAHTNGDNLGTEANSS